MAVPNAERQKAIHDAIVVFGAVTFSEILIHVSPAGENSRVLDSQLQSLRRRGFVKYARNGGWSWIGPPPAKATLSLRDASTKVLEDLDALIAESQGVAGLHKNGDLAPWSELVAGGKYSGWLGSLEDLRKALGR